jgi:hypothetical protein
VWQAYVTICDLLIVFSKHLGDNPLMRPLCYEVDKGMQSHLSNFLTEKVFVEDEDGEDIYCQLLPFSLTTLYKKTHKQNKFGDLYSAYPAHLSSTIC